MSARYRIKVVKYDTKPPDDIDVAFAQFHADNPWVYASLVDLARGLVEQGHRKVGMKMLFEVLRWQHAMRTASTDFKLNNNYTSRYARMIMAQEPDLDGIFEIRKLAAGRNSVDGKVSGEYVEDVQ